MPDIKFSQFTAGGNVQIDDIVVGLRAADNAKFTFPGTGFSDADGNLILGYSSPGVSAINHIFIQNAQTANAPEISAVGTDVDIGIKIAGKGAGSIDLNTVSFSSTGNISGITTAVFPGSGSGQATLEAQAAAGTPTLQLPNASGTLALISDIPGGGGLVWSAISGTSQTATINTGWIPQNVGLTTITLPATAAIGSFVSIQGQGSGGWLIDAPGTQIIRIGSSPTSAGGTVASANRYDAITLVCIVADTEWAMYGPVTSGFTIT